MVSDARGPSLARGAAVITVATAASRITGFLRVVAVAAAMGTTYLANTYQTANTIPNILFELVAAGVLTSVFVPTFVDYLVKGEREQGWRAADALTSVAIVGLIGLAIVVALLAPWIMRALTLGIEDQQLRRQQVEVGADLLRLFAPQIVLYGAGMIMTAALHAHRRFAAAAVAPIFNNVVVIAVYLTFIVAGGPDRSRLSALDPAELILLGGGTTLGVLAMTLALMPSLRALGWRFRPSFDPSHPAVRRASRLGVWALGYAGGYQAGLVVVLLLANRVEGGVAAYQWAYTFFYVPHALFGVPIFNVLFPVMSEDAARGDRDALVVRLRDGLSMLFFIMVPVAAALIAVAPLLMQVVLHHGAMTGTGADLVARVLAAFVLGLPTYSAFLVITRAYYALGDTKTPAIVNAAAIAISSATGVLLFFVLPRGWQVPGLALAHSFGFGVGAAVLARLAREVPIASRTLRTSVIRALLHGALAFAVMAAITRFVPSAAYATGALKIALVWIAGVGTYVVTMRATGSPELDRVAALFRRRFA